MVGCRDEGRQENLQTVNRTDLELLTSNINGFVLAFGEYTETGREM